MVMIYMPPLCIIKESTKQVVGKNSRCRRKASRSSLYTNPTKRNNLALYFTEMSKKFTQQAFENIEIVDISSEGLGVTKINEWVVFVEGAVPGDVCNINVYKKKRKFGFA